MKRIIQELYYGNLNPNAKQFDPASEYGRAMKRIADNEESLLKALEGKERKAMEDFSDSFGTVVDITACECFIDGFRLGARLTFDTFLSNESEFKNLTD